MLYDTCLLGLGSLAIELNFCAGVYIPVHSQSYDENVVSYEVREGVNERHLRELEKREFELVTQQDSSRQQV